jgi:Histidine kinase-like ATPase domain
MSKRTSAGQNAAEKAADAVLRAELPADPRSAREARLAVRQALKAWDMEDPSRDTELLASELVANAAEHAGGKTIGFALWRHAYADGQPAVTCEVSETSPVRPRARNATLDAERGRGLAIVAALSSASGVRASPAGKTTWFTLALSGRAQRSPARPGPKPKRGPDQPMQERAMPEPRSSQTTAGGRPSPMIMRPATSPPETPASGGGTHASTRQLRVGAPAESPSVGNSTVAHAVRPGGSWLCWPRPRAIFTTCADHDVPFGDIPGRQSGSRTTSAGSLSGRRPL